MAGMADVTDALLYTMNGASSLPRRPCDGSSDGIDMEGCTRCSYLTCPMGSVMAAALGEDAQERLLVWSPSSAAAAPGLWDEGMGMVRVGGTISDCDAVLAKRDTVPSSFGSTAGLLFSCAGGVQSPKSEARTSGRGIRVTAWRKRSSVLSRGLR